MFAPLKKYNFLSSFSLSLRTITYFIASGGILQPDMFNVFRTHTVEKNCLNDGGTTISFTRLLVKAVRLNFRYVMFWLQPLCNGAIIWNNNKKLPISSAY